LWQSLGHEALSVHADADHFRAGRPEDERCISRARVFDRGGGAAMQKEPGGEADAFAHARSDEYARRIGHNPAGRCEMSGDGGPQRWQTGLVAAVGQSGSAASRQLFQEQPAPSL
jgi:hypothetical protein